MKEFFRKNGKFEFDTLDTVGELISYLKQFPANAKVYSWDKKERVFTNGEFEVLVSDRLADRVDIPDDDFPWKHHTEINYDEIASVLLI